MDNKVHRTIARLAHTCDFLTAAQLKELITLIEQMEAQNAPLPPLEVMLVREKSFFTKERLQQFKTFHQKTARLKFGETAVKYSFCTQAQVNEVLAKQIALKKDRQPYSRIGEMLAEKGYLKEHQIGVVLQKQKSDQYAKTEAIDDDENGGTSVLFEDQNIKSGTQLGHFTIHNKLDNDWSGTSYRATDRRNNRIVSLKVLSESLQRDKKSMETLVNNLKQAAKLKHPGLFKLYALEKLSDGHYGLAKEFVEGQSLYDYVQNRGPMDHTLALSVIIQIAQALQAANNSGLTHGHLSPSRILIDPNNKIKISGLGLPLQANRDLLTLYENPIDFPAFVPPETYLLTGTPSGKSDIFSLGGTLYYALCGSPPSDKRCPFEYLIDRWEHTTTPVHSVNPSVPESIWSVIRDMLELDPEHRPGDYNDIIAQLENLTKSEQLDAKTASIKIKDIFAEESAEAEEQKPRQKQKTTSKLSTSIFEEISDAPRPTTTAKGTANFMYYLDEEAETKPKSSRKKLWVAAAVGALALGLAAKFMLGGSSPKKSNGGSSSTSTDDDGSDILELPPDADTWKKKYDFYIEHQLPDQADQVIAEMNQAGQAEWDKIASSVDPLIQQLSFQAALDKISAFDLQTYFTQQWVDTVTSEREHVVGAANASYETLKARVDELLAASDFTGARKETLKLQGTDFDDLKMRLNALKDDIDFCEQKTLQEAAEIARQESLAEYSEIIELAEQYKSKFQFMDIDKLLNERISRQDSKLRKDEKDLLRALKTESQKQLNLYRSLANQASAYLAKNQVTTVVDSADVQVVRIAVDTWEYTPVGQKEPRNTIGVADLQPGEVFRVLSASTMDRKQAIMMKSLASFAVYMNEPNTAWAMYHQAILLDEKQKDDALEALMPELVKQSVAATLTSAQEMRQTDPACAVQTILDELKNFANCPWLDATAEGADLADAARESINAYLKYAGYDNPNANIELFDLEADLGDWEIAAGEAEVDHCSLILTGKTFEASYSAEAPLKAVAGFIHQLQDDQKLTLEVGEIDIELRVRGGQISGQLLDVKNIKQNSGKTPARAFNYFLLELLKDQAVLQINGETIATIPLLENASQPQLKLTASPADGMILGPIALVD